MPAVVILTIIHEGELYTCVQLECFSVNSMIVIVTYIQLLHNLCFSLSLHRKATNAERNCLSSLAMKTSKNIITRLYVHMRQELMNRFSTFLVMIQQISSCTSNTKCTGTLTHNFQNSKYYKPTHSTTNLQKLIFRFIKFMIQNLKKSYKDKNPGR